MGDTTRMTWKKRGLSITGQEERDSKKGTGKPRVINGVPSFLSLRQSQAWHLAIGPALFQARLRRPIWTVGPTLAGAKDLPARTIKIFHPIN